MATIANALEGKQVCARLRHLELQPSYVTLEPTDLPETMHELKEHAQGLAELVMEFDPSRSLPSFKREVVAALNGAAENTIRLAYPTSTRRAQSIYVTGSNRASILARKLIPSKRSFKSNCILFDPAYGTGDLLIAAAQRMPLCGSVSETLDAWAKQIKGIEIDQNLADIARLRMVMLVLRQHRAKYPPHRQINREFENLVIGNALSEGFPTDVSHVIMNPPYHREPARPWYQLTSGKLTCAAQFLYRVISQPWPGCRMVALLPDVIRSGSSFEQLRQFVAKSAAINNITLDGTFSKEADIDVFMMQATISSKEQQACFPTTWPEAKGVLLADKFFVRVGSVVPHRLPADAPTGPYLDVTGLPTTMKGEVRETSIQSYEGKLFKPPFVVIRRTSSPDDRLRNAAYIVRGKQPIAVENHLIAIFPKDGRLDSCRSLVDSITHEKTRNWMNMRIRCRHLTVRAVNELPLIGWE